MDVKVVSFLQLFWSWSMFATEHVMVTGKSFGVTVSWYLSRNVRCLSRGKIIWPTETDSGASQEKFFNWWRLYFNLALVAFLATRFVPLDFRHYLLTLLVVGMLSFFLETTTFSFCCFLQTAHPRHLVFAFDVFYKRRIRVLLGRRVISMNLFQLTLTEIVNFPFQK